LDNFQATVLLPFSDLAISTFGSIISRYMAKDLELIVHHVKSMTQNDDLDYAIQACNKYLPPTSDLSSLQTSDLIASIELAHIGVRSTVKKSLRTLNPRLAWRMVKDAKKLIQEYYLHPAVDEAAEDPSTRDFLPDIKALLSRDKGQYFMAGFHISENPILWSGAINYQFQAMESARAVKKKGVLMVELGQMHRIGHAYGLSDESRYFEDFIAQGYWIATGPLQRSSDFEVLKELIPMVRHESRIYQDKGLPKIDQPLSRSLLIDTQQVATTIPGISDVSQIDRPYQKKLQSLRLRKLAWSIARGPLNPIDLALYNRVDDSESTH
jgi:hypothetical protein